MSAPPHSQKPASAAAMDALDLDDLFLEGDDGPSLFADMEIDLGDMGNIFDAPGGAAAAAGGGPSGPAASYNNQRGGGDLLSQEFGRPSSAGSNRGKRVRTAKTNPHLLAAAAAEQEGGTESAQKRQSAIQKELQRLQDSNEMVIDSKRKRRRSKKNQDDNNEDANHKKDAEAAATGRVASKKKRRNSSKTNSNTQQTELPPPQQTQPHLQQQQQALQQIFHQMNPQQKERLQKKAEAMGLNIFAASSTSPTPQSQSQTNLINQQENIADCGLQPSTTFYPFCALPPELDIKRGQKVFPVLEKINATSAPSSHHHHANTDDDQSMHASASTLITASSPLYTLFHQHLGLIQNSDRGISDLAEAVKLTNTSMTRDGGKKKTAQELSKLLTQCLKQSVFIKQNLSNLESFVKGGEASWNDTDIQSLFPDKNATADTTSAAASSSLPSSGGIMATNNKDKTSPASKRGTPNASTQAHGGPMISVKVKVRVPGWRDKSGARLVAKLSCPPGWKAAMNRENLKAETKKASSSENVPSPVSTTTTKSTASRKRKAKESSASVSASTKGASSTKRGSASKIAVPFVSVHQDQETTSKQNQEHQDPSILHNLFTKILRPSISPAQRRELLANEISSTLSRLENARVTQQWTKARKIQGQMKALQSVYKDDIDIVPDMCNTIGMWRWMEHTKYFKDIEEEGEVYQELEDCLHEEKDEEVFESKGSILEEGTLWGSSALSEMRRVSTASTDGNEDDKDDTDGMNDDIEPSPLFDRLQSLLVEVDGSDDEEDDDDDVIASLPQFSSDQFINGPAGDNASDKNMIDVSALTLDQRTYIQLRAAGLIDATAPPSSVLKRALPAASTSDNEDCQSIGRILNKMKMRLSNLQSESNNTKVTALQRKALLHVRQAPERKQRERDEDAVLTKYKQLQKIQKEQKEEKKRSSSRARAGSD